MSISGVYSITHIESGRQYIGSSIDIEKRWKEHRWLLARGVHHSPYLQRVWNKYGEASFGFDLVEQVVSEKEPLLEREQHYLDELKPAFNICPTAGNRLGSKQSPEAIEKVRRTHLGRKRSDETRERMSEAAMGNTKGAFPKSEETRVKISEALTGRQQRGTGWHYSEETRRKMSETQQGYQNRGTGWKHSEETREKMRKARLAYYEAKRAQNADQTSV